MKVTKMLEEIRMSQNQFQIFLGFSRNKIYRHEKFGDVLKDWEVEEVKNKVIKYASNEIKRLTKLIERLSE